MSAEVSEEFNRCKEEAVFCGSVLIGISLLMGTRDLNSPCLGCERPATILPTLSPEDSTNLEMAVKKGGERRLWGMIEPGRAPEG